MNGRCFCDMTMQWKFVKMKRTFSMFQWLIFSHISLFDSFAAEKSTSCTNSNNLNMPYPERYRPFNFTAQFVYLSADKSAANSTIVFYGERQHGKQNYHQTVAASECVGFVTILIAHLSHLRSARTVTYIRFLMTNLLLCGLHDANRFESVSARQISTNVAFAHKNVNAVKLCFTLQLNWIGYECNRQTKRSELHNTTHLRAV